MVAMAPVTSPPGERIILHQVSWGTYESLVKDHIDRSVPHFTYDRGELEIGSPSPKHEQENRSLAMLVEVVAEELAIDVLNVGSTTFKREDLQRGFKPDSGFYIQNEAVVSAKEELDLTLDPPPDLVIEIDLTHPSLDKLPILAGMGIPEVWRVAAGQVAILRLGASGYQERTTSEVLPLLTSERLTWFLGESKRLKRTAWLRTVRSWVRDQAAPNG